MSAREASMYHMEKLEITEDLKGLADHSLNPSMRAIRNLMDVWRAKTVGGLDNTSMSSMLQTYQTQNPHLTIDMDCDDKAFCAVLVTPFMRRVSGLKESAEIIFIDSTANCDQLNMSVTPLLCCSPAGALPGAIAFTSSQDEETYTRGK